MVGDKRVGPSGACDRAGLYRKEPQGWHMDTRGLQPLAQRSIEHPIPQLTDRDSLQGLALAEVGQALDGGGHRWDRQDPSVAM